MNRWSPEVFVYSVQHCYQMLPEQPLLMWMFLRILLLLPSRLMRFLWLQDGTHFGVTLTSHMSPIAQFVLWRAKHTPSLSTHTHRATHTDTLDNGFIHSFSHFVPSFFLFFLSYLLINTVKLNKPTHTHTNSIFSQTLWPGFTPVCLFTDCLTVQMYQSRSFLVPLKQIILGVACSWTKMTPLF